MSRDEPPRNVINASLIRPFTRCRVLWGKSHGYKFRVLHTFVALFQADLNPLRCARRLKLQVDNETHVFLPEEMIGSMESNRRHVTVTRQALFGSVTPELTFNLEGKESALDLPIYHHHSSGNSLISGSWVRTLNQTYSILGPVWPF